MKFQEHNNSVETNVTGESKTFGIGDASKIISILRDKLYENKIQTLVQEYICNARDAMREIGKGNDFQITMPTRIEPTFKVRDFGPGITPERMEKVFILYGASTKSGSNNQTGGFGIGAKSAWSYTDSFAVITVVDGVRRSYVCHTGSNNQGSLDLVSTDHTDEPNGTEIQVAVKINDIQEFQSAIYRAIYFWEKRPTLKGTQQEAPALVSGYKISDNIETIRISQIPAFVGLSAHVKALAVIDGVPYEITDKLINKCEKLHQFLLNNLRWLAVLHFGNGLVEVSASRESISDSPFTVNALNLMGRKGATVVKNHVQDTFAKVKNVSDWIQTYKQLSPYLKVDEHSAFGEYSIRGGDIFSESFKLIHMTLAHSLDKRKRYRVERITKEEIHGRYNEKNIPLEMLNQVFVVTKTETTIVQNKRLRAFLQGKPDHLSKVILIQYSGNPAIVDKLVHDLGIKAFETLEIPEEPKKERVEVTRELTEFCMHSLHGTRHIYTTLADNQSKYLYVEIESGIKWEGYDQNELRSLSYFLKEQNGTKIVGLAPRAVKMVKGDPNFTPLRDWLASYVPGNAEVNFTIASKACNGNDIGSILDLKDIQDDFLAEMIKEYKILKQGTRKTLEIPEILMKKVVELPATKQFIEKDEKLKNILENKYPLVKEFSKYSEQKKELAYYINAKHNIAKGA